MELHLTNLVLVLAAALAGGAVARRFGHPAILGELVIGILLGPPLLGLLDSDEALSVLANLGILLMMLYVGLHLDLSDLYRASRAGLLAAVGGFVVPAVAGVALVLAFGGSVEAALFVGLAMGVTSLATKSRILVDLRILDTRVAHVMMAGALFADMVALIAFSALLGVETPGGFTPTVILPVALKAALFVAGTFVVGTFLFPIGGRMLRSRGIDDRTTVFMLVVIIGLGFAAVAELAGIHGILGAFMAGLFIQPGVLDARLARDVERLMQQVSVGFLAPIFFVTAGFAVTLDVFVTDLPLLVTVVAVATLGKVLGTALFYLPSGRGWREGVTVGVGMNGRGAVEVIVAELALQRGLIDQATFSVLVLMALITTAAVPLMLPKAVAWLRRRGELVRSNSRFGTIIVGAGPAAREIGRVLAAEEPVWFVDTNLDNCNEAESEGLAATHGNALDEEILRHVGAGDALRILALTPSSSINVLVAQLATSHFGVPHADVVLTPGDAGSLGQVAADTGSGLISDTPVDLELWNRRVRFDGVRLETLPLVPELVGEEPSAIAGDERLPVLVRRGNELLTAGSRLVLEPGDEVLGFRFEVPGPDLVSPSHRQPRSAGA